MRIQLNRRALLKTAAASAALGLIPRRAATAEAGPSLTFGEPVPFSYDMLKDLAARLARSPYAAPPRPAPAIVQRIDYEEWGKIKFDTDHALYASGRESYPVSFFHLGQWFPKAVTMYKVEDGQARPIVYSPRYFHMPAESVAQGLPPDAGFAGFRVQEARDGALDWRRNDWAAFLGASYFRAIGELHQYGMSSRGVAIDSAVADRPEEFPDFTRFYLSEPKGGDNVTVYALLEGPSVVGAYRFVMRRGKGVVMDIDQTLHLRRPVERFGIAPLTSMYWFSETVKPTGIDWRPEVHDSDGLSMWTGAGEHIWRPLNNPPHVVTSSFLDDNPRGFGLLQRDRVFGHYLDGVYYDRRPSVWVEPIGDWGKGAVQLIEIPTDDEIHDNIVAAWVPEKKATAGTQVTLKHRLHWLADEPYPTPLARCVATRLGRGGQPGQPRPKGVRKFMLEFLGGPLVSLPFGVKPEMHVTASRGEITPYKIIEAVSDGVPGHWRVEFDLAGVHGPEPVELRLYLTAAGSIASETWLYQYHPF
ncbi:MAG: glucan biosynthesis protein D [Rhodospirillales bacterium CG15_BIG_FIL_POST_REV_8_21_14_020_66_15]|nr:MAG: glucan biosynthesis protein D [Rhodospirillales bacterium CG15_BIG_FIL_POST_REV_8_21_14_020_66_15]